MSKGRFDDRNAIVMKDDKYKRVVADEMHLFEDEILTKVAFITNKKLYMALALKSIIDNGELPNREEYESLEATYNEEESTPTLKTEYISNDVGTLFVDFLMWIHSYNCGELDFVNILGTVEG